MGIYLTADVFTHGQLYVAFSRATSKKGVLVHLNEPLYLGRNKYTSKNFTYNCVYKEVFDDNFFL